MRGSIVKHACARPASAKRATRLQVRCKVGAIKREVLARSERTKMDPGNDLAFYEFPRLVTHVDNNFLAQVTQLYRELIPPGGTVLDLCSSHVSHLPPEITYKKVIGHGMNAQELARNPRLDHFFIRNFNEEPRDWAIKDDSLDAVVCCVSVQYWQQPEAVCAEVVKKLKPGGVCIITFSNRCFPTKAITAWQMASSGYARVQLVKQYFQAVEGFTTPFSLTEVPLPNKEAPLSSRLPGFLAPVAKLFERSASDPFYAVVAYKEK